MISVKDRAPLHPGRVQLNPVTGQPNIFDLMRADSPTEVGTALNRRTMQLLQADIRTLPVSAGQTITAGNVVNVVSGAVTKAGTPTQAIALQSGTAGQSIDIIFDGVAELPGITAGTQIASAGVQGYAPQDGWLWVRPWWVVNSGLRERLLLKSSTTASNATTVSMPLGDINFNEYLQLEIRFIPAYSADSSTVYTRMNNMSGRNNYSTRYFGGNSALASDLLNTDIQVSSTVIIDCTSKYISGQCFQAGVNPNISIYNVDYQNTGVLLQNLTSINYVSSSQAIPTGTQLLVYGVKK